MRKFGSICLLLSASLSGGLPAKAGTNVFFNTKVNGKTVAVGLPFEVRVVESPVGPECKALGEKSLKLLTAKEYKKLDELASTLRSSKERWAGGSWKLDYVYSGLIPERSAPETEWAGRLADLQQWVAADAKSITSQVALASFWREYAWKARGGGYADSVRDEGWKLFEERLKKAARALANTRTNEEDCPFAGPVAMWVAIGQSATRPEFDRIFNQAIKAHPDYEPNYEARATYLMPRWHGEEGEWERDLDVTADRIGGDKGDELYAQVAWGMSEYFSNVWKESALSWARVDRGFQIIEEKFPNSIGTKNERAFLACLANKPRIAVKCFEETGGKVDLAVWEKRQRYEQFAIWAYSTAARSAEPLPSDRR